MLLYVLCHLQGNSPQAQAIAANLSQKLNQLKRHIQDALVMQVADDFIDIASPLKQMSDAAFAPLGLFLLHQIAAGIVSQILMLILATTCNIG